MGRRLIGILILLATASVAGIIVTQIYWLNKAFEVRQSQIDLRKEQELAEAKRFNDRVTIALTNVANEILTINDDPAELFQAVKQVRPNFFTVAINDTVHPYLLESLLRTEFEIRNIGENFEYGIYDCFTDSIVYGEYVSIGDTIATDQMEEPGGTAPQIKWDKDGHYFSVFFPNREPFTVAQESSAKVSTWAFSAIITFIVFLFFAYAVYIVMRQKRLSEMKTDFINNMTHELKTPISTISLSSEVLMKDEITENPDRLHRYARLIFAEVQRLKLQVDKVLQLATLEKKGVELKKEPLDVHACIREMIEAVKPTRSADGLDLTLDLRAQKHFILGDPVHIANIMHNLMDNAIKYSGANPVITWSTIDVGNEIQIEVSDRGTGIDKGDLPYIFDKFYRVPTGNRHDVKGFGLGLHYVKSMVLAHKGKISAQSELGVGTKIRMKFPITTPRT